MTNRSAVFVLAACDDGPMLVARTDAYRVGNSLIGVGAALLGVGSHAQGEIDVLLKLSMARARQKPVGGFTVLDVGANIGAHTIPWAKYMYGWGSIIAFEAQERMFYALAGNITLNNCFNARAIWAAVSDRCGYMPGPTMDYEKPANFGGVSMLPQYNSEQPVKDYQSIVPMLSIDSMNPGRVDMIKIDVEGMEPQVIRGARETIERNRPVVTAEWIVGDEQEIMKALPDDYRCQKQDINLLCMHKDDSIWQSIVIGEAA